MTATVRDEAGRFTVDHGPLPDIARTPRDGFHLRYDPDAESARRELAKALAAFLPATPACADDPDAWYGDGGGHRSSAQRIAKAIAACARCPLRHPCDAVGEYERHGVWGGTDRSHHVEADRDPGQRRPAPGDAKAPPALPRRVRRGRPLPVPCGWCGVGAGEVCIVAAGTPSERNHAERQRSAATGAAA